MLEEDDDTYHFYQYYAAVSAASPSHTGGYKVSVKLVDDYSENVTTSGNVTHAPEGLPTGGIETAGDVDWLKISLAKGQTYLIDLLGEERGEGTLPDPYIRGIYDSQGQLLPGTANDDKVPGKWLDSGIYFTPQTGGDYFIAAGAYGSNTGTYRLEWTSIYDAPNNNSTQFFLDPTLSGRVTSHIETTGDEDWFRTWLVAGNTYQIDLWVDIVGPPLQGPVSLEVFDHNENYIAGTLDDIILEPPESESAKFEFIPDTTGVYFISVKGYEDQIGNYSLGIYSPSSDFI